MDFFTNNFFFTFHSKSRKQNDAKHHLPLVSILLRLANSCMSDARARLISGTHSTLFILYFKYDILTYIFLDFLSVNYLYNHIPWVRVCVRTCA